MVRFAELGIVKNLTF